MQVDSVSFKSRINFVDMGKMYSKAHGVPIYSYPFDECLKKADNFFTERVRTCTAGGIFNTKTGESAGFHYYSSKSAYKNIGKFIDNLLNSIKNPDKCFILGGKSLKCAPYSIEQFCMIKEALEREVGNITIFEEHLIPCSETDLYYSKKDDMWNICTAWRKRFELKHHEITKPEDIQTCFRSVQISPDDEITFGL